MGTLEDFLHYLRRHKLPILDAVVVGVAAWYDPHTAVVFLFCAAVLFGAYSLDLVGRFALDGAAIRGELCEAKKELKEKFEREVADVRRELSMTEKTEDSTDILLEVAALQGEVSGLRRSVHDLEDANSLRKDIEAVKRVLGDIRLELTRRDAATRKVNAFHDHTASLLAAKTAEEVENLSREPQVRITDEEFNTADDDAEGLIGRVRAFRRRSSAQSTELRILRDAIEGIDPKAVRTVDDINWWDNHAKERYEDHSRGVRSPYDRPEPSIARLEKEIEELKRRIQGGGT